MILGYSVFISSIMLILLLPLTAFSAFLVALFYGAYFGVVETVQRALIPEYVCRNLRGTAYGIYYLTVGLAFFVSNALVGSLWEYFGSSLAVTYSVITSFIAITFMMLFLKRKK